MTNVLVTGATGFVGRHLCELLASGGDVVTGTTRRSVDEVPAEGPKFISVGDLGSAVDWEPLLKGVDCVVHLAARVHVMRELDADPLAAFRRVNVAGTKRLIGQACDSGVRRFIYLSSVKVLGDAAFDRPFRVSDTPRPTDPYGQSKLEAERVVEQVAAESKLETVIIRPPLVYGPGVGGNFVRLLQMVDKNFPLPFGRIDNKRSLVSVHNLCHLIQECLANSEAAGKTFLVSDNADISTRDLVRMMANAMSRTPRLVPVPVSILRGLAGLLGRSDEADRLLGSLQVDMSHTTSTLNWEPPTSIENGIGETVKWFRNK